MQKTKQKKLEKIGTKSKKTKKVFSNLKTNGTNRKFIIFLKLKAKRIKKIKQKTKEHK